MSAGKGSKRRTENFSQVQKNWEEIDWGKGKKPLVWAAKVKVSLGEWDIKTGKYLGPGKYEVVGVMYLDNNKSKCCNSSVWVEGETTKFYVCGKCDKPCDVH